MISATRAGESWTREVHVAVAPIAGEWDELAARVGAPPFLRPGWFNAWWRAFGRGSLEILVLRDGGRLAGVLPMARRAGVLGSLSNWHTPEFAPVAVPDAGAPLARMLLRGARRVTLRFVHAHDPLVVACREQRHRVLVRTIERSPYLDLQGTWEELERSRIASKHRAVRRRRQPDLMADGALALEVTDGRIELDRRLAEGFEVEARSSKGKFALGLTSYEFLGQDAPWKRERTDTSRDRVAVQVFATAGAGRLDWARCANARPHARRLHARLRR